MSPQSVARIDLAAVRSNFRTIRSMGGPLVRVSPVVKDDAYGMGMVSVSRALEDAGADALTVALASEAVQLRESGFRGEILVLHPLESDEVCAMCHHGGIATVWSTQDARLLAREVFRGAVPLKVHVEIDTGMNRGGVEPDDLLAVADILDSTPSLLLHGVFSHLSDATDQEFSELQRERFMRSVAELKDRGIEPGVRHLAASGGILLGEAFHLDQVRPGLALYGTWPQERTDAPRLHPVLSVASRLLGVRAVAPGESVGYNRAFMADRPLRIGVVPMGYAQGIHRTCSDACVLVRGHRCRMVGLVSMDLLAVDLTEVPQADIGDETILLGRQGQEEITLREWARWMGSIPYEVLCRFGRLNRREFIG